MDIVCSADNNYVMPTGIMLTSLFENNKESEIRIHLLDGGISDVSRTQLTDICNKYNQRIIFYSMDNTLFSDFPMGEEFQVKHINTMATYFRLYMTKVLPNDIDKIIYLDGDIIVLDSLLPLWNWQMGNKPIAAVPDPYNNAIKHYNRLRYSQCLGYFNAGVLLVNLKYWRENYCLDNFLYIVYKYRDCLSSHDQDVLNISFKENKLELPIKYNIMPEYLWQIKYNPISWEYEEQIKEAQNTPVIIHFTYIPKPWFKDCKNPYKKEFERYRSLTIWKNMKEKKHGNILTNLLHWAIKILVLLHIKPLDTVIEYRYINFDKYAYETNTIRRRNPEVQGAFGE